MSELKPWPKNSTLWYAMLRGLDPLLETEIGYTDQEHNYMTVGFALGSEPGGLPTVNLAACLSNRKSTCPDTTLVIRSVGDNPDTITKVYARLRTSALALGINPEHNFLIGPGGQRCLVCAGDEPPPDTDTLQKMLDDHDANNIDGQRLIALAEERGWYERAKLRFPENDPMVDCLPALNAVLGYTIMQSWSRNPGKRRWRP